MSIDNAFQFNFLKLFYKLSNIKEKTNVILFLFPHWGHAWQDSRGLDGVSGIKPIQLDARKHPIFCTISLVPLMLP